MCSCVYGVAIDEASNSCVLLYMAVAHPLYFSIWRCWTAHYKTSVHVYIRNYMMVGSSATAARYAFFCQTVTYN